MTKNNIAKKLRISFIYLVKNEQKLIKQSLDSVIAAAEHAGLNDYEVIVINDGSTDNTVSVAESLKSPKIKVITQENKGRLKTTIAGLRLASFEYVVIMGARVRLHEKSLKFIKSQLNNHPERNVWNAHIDIPRVGLSQAGFWYVVTYAAWRRYLSKPRYMTFGIEDFDYYPKGTGAFFAPKNLIIEAYENLDSIYDNAKFASDDTTMMRNIAKKQNINISPEYSADYIARTDLKSFTKHAYNRGTFLLDSYMRKGTRLYYAVIAYFPIALASVALLLLFPLQILGIVVIGYVIVAIFLGLVARLRADDIASFLLLAPIFTIVYSVGIWRGLFALMHQKLGAKTDA